MPAGRLSWSLRLMQNGVLMMWRVGFNQRWLHCISFQRVWWMLLHIFTQYFRKAVEFDKEIAVALYTSTVDIDTKENKHFQLYDVSMTQRRADSYLSRLAHFSILLLYHNLSNCDCRVFLLLYRVLKFTLMRLPNQRAVCGRSHSNAHNRHSSAYTLMTHSFYRPASARLNKVE